LALLAVFNILLLRITDLKVTIEALKTALVMMENTTTFGEELGCRFTTESYPACKHIPFRTDEYWECYARQFSITLHHPG